MLLIIIQPLLIITFFPPKYKISSKNSVKDRKLLILFVNEIGLGTYCFRLQVRGMLQQTLMFYINELQILKFWGFLRSQNTWSSFGSVNSKIREQQEMLQHIDYLTNDQLKQSV